MSRDITLLPACELLNLYQAKAVSPVEVTQLVLDRIAELDPILNAFCLVDEESTLAAARASESRWQKEEPIGLLDGIPTAIKDLLLTRDWPTLRGSLTIDKDQPWTEDSPCVARLREHGAILVGKTTTPEFGWKGVTNSPRHGVTCNPWNTKMTPGGSSGGSAVAAATGMTAVAIGTDGGGSIRIPCGFTGLYGLKPSFGRVPAYPASPFGTVAHVGPITRTVADSALLLSVISEPDPRDWYSLPFEQRDYRVGIQADVKGLRLAYSPNLGYVQVDDEVGELVRNAVQVFADLGAHIDEIDPGFDDPWDCFTKTWFCGAANLANRLNTQQRDQLDPGLLQIIEQGETFSLNDYLQAQNERAALGQRMKMFHQDYDLLLTPTLPIPAFSASRESPEQMDTEPWSSWTPFTFPFNLTGQPAASIPCGLSSAGLPVGLQIIGSNYDDALVLQASHAFESAFRMQLPDISHL